MMKDKPAAATVPSPLAVEIHPDGPPEDTTILLRHLRKYSQTNFEVLSPAERVQIILEGENDGGTRVSHPLFSEMAELVNQDGEMQWLEVARWIKFEEVVEEGGARWSKPYVASLSLTSLFELRSLLLNNTLILDMDANCLSQISEKILEDMHTTGQLVDENLRKEIHEAIIRPHRHLHEKHSSAFYAATQCTGGGKNGKALKKLARDENQDDEQAFNKGNVAFMKKIPQGAEAANILVGEMSMKQTVSAFVRLSRPLRLGDLTEVPVPTRFIFILLGPKGDTKRYKQIGRAMATLMTDEVFHDVAYKAITRSQLLAGVDEVLAAVTVLPPGAWDPNIRIEPPPSIPSQDPRKHGIASGQTNKVEISEEEEEAKIREESGLTRSGRLFGGIINDVKRKLPWYLSDFRDGLSLQCVATWIFLYFACLTPIITFGGLLGKATHGRMAAIESLVAGFLCGIGYGFFSGQPLTVLGSTGPVLVFETIIYQFCETNGLNYLELRLWIGIWVGVILLILVAVDASALVCYITRFTEETFASLIALIFMVSAVKNVAEILKKYPVNKESSRIDGYSCECKLNTSGIDYPDLVRLNFSSTNVEFSECESVYNGTLVGNGCHYVPDVFFVSVLLFIMTFLISVTLKDFRGSSFFPSRIRVMISDFGVIIAIILMTLVDMFFGVKTPKLLVPETFQPTLPDERGWLISPYKYNPFWTIFAAILPALLATILIFMDQQITAVIVNRKEHKLKKGCGYHQDLFVLSILITICSFLGIPWFVAATTESVNHVKSLRMESESAAPGEKPQFLGVREQRVTHILIFTTVGLSVMMTPLLRNIPMPVLYGVFLYMGVNALRGMQLYDRILLLFMPVKWQPDFMYLRKVPLLRVHMFTGIQLGCLVILWVVKSLEMISILFPLMLLVIILVRKLLDYVFSQRELKSLDDIMPGSKDRHRDLEEESERATGRRYSVHVPLTSGNVLTIPTLSAVNITEEINKSGVWKSVNKESSGHDKGKELMGFIGMKKRRNSSRDAQNDEEPRRLSISRRDDDKYTINSNILS